MTAQARPCPRCGAPLPRQGALEGLCPACILRVDGGVGAGLPKAPEAFPGVPETPDLSDVQRDFPDLEILEPIGRGGMGIVYRARQTRLDRVVALKVLVPSLAQDPAFAERFLREAQAMAKLQHPSVVTIYDFGERHGRYYLLMEYVEGPSLRERIESGPLSPLEALGLIPSICEGLQYAHDLGLVHRDIKPENLLVDRQGRVRIADFGLVRLLDEEASDWRLTRASQVMGTPQYMAPEQMSKPLAVDHRADLYSLGIVLYELLMGVPPAAPFAPPSSLHEDGAALDELVLKAIDRDPNKRFDSAQAMGDHVSALLAPPTPKQSKAKTRRPDPNIDGQRVAFTNEDKWGGLQVAEGWITLQDDRLVIEYRMKDCFEITSSAAKSATLLLTDLATIQYDSNWVGQTKIVLNGRKMDFCQGLTEFRAGSVRLKITRTERRDAKKLVNEVRKRLAQEPYS